MTRLRVALIGGDQYGAVDAALVGFTEATGIEVDVAFRGDHPTLNRHLAQALPAGEPYDLVSTHSKYAPAQARWLRPLDGGGSGAHDAPRTDDAIGPAAPEAGEVDAGEVDLGEVDLDLGAFRPTALDLCRVGGVLRSLPRNIDARLLLVATDVVGEPPATWAELADAAAAATTADRAGFAFPAWGSGLFGTFYELTVAHGAHLFDEHHRPTLATPAAEAALAWLVDLHRVRRATPTGMVGDERPGAPARPGWYFDDVAAGFRSGAVAMVGDWPGYWSLLAGAVDLDLVGLARLPAGPAGRAVYAGCHSWAIPVAATDPIGAARLLAHLAGPVGAAGDAAAGMVPARIDVDVPARHPLEVRRAELLAATVEQDLLTFPPMATYPAVEEVASTALVDALAGRRTVAEALVVAQARALAVVDATATPTPG